MKGGGWWKGVHSGHEVGSSSIGRHARKRVNMSVEVIELYWDLVEPLSWPDVHLLEGMAPQSTAYPHATRAGIGADTPVRD